MTQGNYFTPQSIKDVRCGPRRDVAPLLALVETQDPAFRYVAKALQDMVEAGVELTADSIEIAVRVGRRKHSTEAAKRHNRPARRSIVYYIRRGDFIKIGTTVDPAMRLKSLMPDEILAFEPGGVELERHRHQQFRSARVARKCEYFHPTEDLNGHVAELRKRHGNPDPAWPSVATLGSTYVRTRTPVRLPAPKTDEKLTATAAAKLLGMTTSTVQGWVHRGLVEPSGRDDKGRPLYFVDHMRFIKERNRAWQNHQKHRSG